MRGVNKHRSPHIAGLASAIKGVKGSSLFNAPAPFTDIGRIDKPTKKRIAKKQTKEGMNLENKVSQI